MTPYNLNLSYPINFTNTTHSTNDINESKTNLKATPETKRLSSTINEIGNKLNEKNVRKKRKRSMKKFKINANYNIYKNFYLSRYGSEEIKNIFNKNSNLTDKRNGNIFDDEEKLIPAQKKMKMEDFLQNEVFMKNFQFVKLDGRTKENYIFYKTISTKMPNQKLNQ